MLECHQPRPVSAEHSQDQQRVVRWTNARVIYCLLGYTYTLSKHCVPLKHPLQQNITCPFTRQPPEQHVCSQQNLLSPVCFSNIPHKTVSRKHHNTTESPTKPQIPTSFCKDVNTSSGQADGMCFCSMRLVLWYAMQGLRRNAFDTQWNCGKEWESSLAQTTRDKDSEAGGGRES